MSWRRPLTHLPRVTKLMLPLMVAVCLTGGTAPAGSADRLWLAEVGRFVETGRMATDATRPLVIVASAEGVPRRLASELSTRLHAVARSSDRPLPADVSGLMSLGPKPDGDPISASKAAAADLVAARWVVTRLNPTSGEAIAVIVMAGTAEGDASTFWLLAGRRTSDTAFRVSRVETQRVHVAAEQP